MQRALRIKIGRVQTFWKQPGHLSLCMCAGYACTNIFIQKQCRRLSLCNYGLRVRLISAASQRNKQRQKWRATRQKLPEHIMQNAHYANDGGRARFRPVRRRWQTVHKAKAISKVSFKSGVGNIRGLTWEWTATSITEWFGFPKLRLQILLPRTRPFR